MAFIPTPFVAKIAFRGRLFNNDLVNTIWAERTDEEEWDADSLETLANNTLSWWAAQIVPHLSNDYSLADVTTTAQFSSTAPSIIVVPDPPVIGGITSQSAPSSICLTISFVTNARGRSFRGRNYIGGIPNVDITDNMIEADFATPIRAGYLLLDVALAFTASIHVVCSHFADNLPRTVGVTTPVTTYRYHDLNIDAQRRRLNNRGS